MMDNQTALDKDFKSEEDKENTSETERERDELDDLFDDFVSKQSLFKDKDVLSLRHVPNTIPHRQKQIKKLNPTSKQNQNHKATVKGKTKHSEQTKMQKHTQKQQTNSKQTNNKQMNNK